MNKTVIIELLDKFKREMLHEIKDIISKIEEDFDVTEENLEFLAGSLEDNIDYITKCVEED